MSKGNKEWLLLVDENDRYLGETEKEECHREKGCLHRAFLVMMTNEKAELMQARRSGKKRLWPHFWDGTVAGHFHKGESPKESVKKRVFEETGVKCGDLEYLFKFRYQAAFEDIGSENEICHVFKADNFKAEEIAINQDEVSEYRFSSLPSLKNEIEASPEEYTPWFLIAVKKLLEIS
jgi:isopentenyl-diphosphate delta-isomerase